MPDPCRSTCGLPWPGYVLRRPIQRVMPVILGSGVMLLLLIPALVLTLWVVGVALDLIF